jgi:hypothetical protein
LISCFSLSTFSCWLILASTATECTWRRAFSLERCVPSGGGCPLGENAL